MPKKKQVLFKDRPSGLQMHAGKCPLGKSSVWHSDDGGKSWWSGYVFGHGAKMMTTKMLRGMCRSVLHDLSELP